MNWIDPKDKIPSKKTIFWGMFDGRSTQTIVGFYPDIEIRLMIIDDLDRIWDLSDYTLYYFINNIDPIFLPLHLTIFAWMPYEDMKFPDFVKEYLEKNKYNYE